MAKKLFLIASIVILLFSCTYDTLEDKNSDSALVIKTGTACGWCTLNDTLTISGNTVRYVNCANCSNVSPTVSKTGTLSDTELEALHASLNFSELQKLDLNSCNVCFDGCDDWIQVTSGTESHYIRFGGSETELQPIKAFIGQISLIKAKYTGEN
ncbi:MAG: hypothetical protein WAO52_00465 [Prolixibacteraceae bacterium]